jgi:hypothetical protein
MNPSRQSPSLGLSLFLTGLVFPGLGQWYLGKKFRALLFMFSTLIVICGAFFRYMVVLFALANKRGPGRPPSFQTFKLMAEAWSLDHRVLWALVISLLLLWIMAVIDVWWNYPRGGNLGKN